MCSRSASNRRLQLRNRRITATATSKIGSPRETMGIATATTVGAFCDPASAIALSRNPISKLPQSPRKIDAGLKLYRRNPATAPARASVRKSTPSLWNAIETTQVTSVEKSADPAASPSRPSIKLNALVIHRTQTIVSGSPTSHPNCGSRTKVPLHPPVPQTSCTRSLPKNRRSAPAGK